MSQLYRQLGTRLDVVGRRGLQIGIFNAAATDSGGASMPLPGWSVSGHVYDAAEASVGDITFDTSAAASDGIVRYWFAQALTASLDATPFALPVQYTYQIKLTDPDGIDRPFVYGDLRLIDGTGK